MADYKYELPTVPDELRHAQTDREKAYLNHINSLTEKIQRDFSTGMFHKEEFDRRMSAEGSGVFIFVDGDGLKKINDTTQDHAAGDAAIKALARGIQDALRAQDNVTVARAGGDEFVVFVEGIPLSTGTTIAKRILESIRNQKIEYKGADSEIKEILLQWPLTASIGVGRTREEADKAMYQAKERGRNRVEYSLPQTEERSRKNIARLALRLIKQGKKELSDKLIKSIQE